MTLSVSRKTDRTKMAAAIAALCADLGATCEVRDMATYRYPDGSGGSCPREIWCIIKHGAVEVTVDLDGDSGQQREGTWVLAWVTDINSHARFASRFGSAAGGTANGRKCTAVTYGGFEGLTAGLRRALECVNAGEALGEPAAYMVREGEGSHGQAPHGCYTASGVRISGGGIVPLSAAEYAAKRGGMRLISREELDAILQSPALAA